jgi:hypothetical protein
MKKYQVSLSYTGYMVCVVEAESEDEAFEKAEASEPKEPNDLERWPDADMIEEL